MVSYGNIYEFAFDSQNGADFLIVISKKYYSGEVMRRPLGRAPVLKRENNGHIYGTSLEIYAECTVEGEYAQFYTSDAFEFRVQLYKNGSLLWMGYVSPELYSEPDVAPPYDVQIIATDSLGELKNYAFASNGTDSLLNHLNHILGMSLSYQMISDLRYEKSSGAISNSSSEIMNVRIDLGHEDGESCYDVLQRLLESFNLNITQYNERWLLFRETDLINLASSDGVIAHDSSGSQVLLDIAHFGSMSECEWWPVGQLSTVIEPARKKVTVQSPNHYKNNALDAADWDVSNGASYDSTAGAYILPDEGSYIVQKLDFPEEVGYRLALRVRAMNVGTGNEDQGIGIMLKVNAHVASGYVDYYLLQHEETDRGVGSYYWYTKEGWIEGELAVPMSSDTSSDAQDIDIIIPLYDSRDQGFGTTSWIYARSIEVTIFNPQGTHDIHVYDVQLSKYDQSEGYQSDVTINNGAREEGDDIEMSLTDGSTVPAAGSIFMTGVPMEYPSAVITKWAVGDDAPDILLNTISKDYARAVALPRMRYTGSLNVPKGMTIPVLFVRDNTFYFPNTYSYDLWNDEVEVDLISVPAAEVSIASSVISQMASSGASSSGGSGSGGGGGIGTVIDLSGFARKDDLTALSELLASMWSIDPDTRVLTTDKDVRIKGNLIVEKDSASGGTSDSTTNIGTVDHIIVSGKPYYPDNAGVVDLTEAFEGLQVDVDLSGYLKTTDIAAWAKKPSLDLSDVPDLSSKYLPLVGGKTMTGTIKTSFNGSFLEDESGNGIIGVDLSSGSWSGVESGDAFGTVVRPTTIRSSGDNLYHYNTNKATAYKIVDANNIADMTAGYAKMLTTGTYRYMAFSATDKYVAFGDAAAISGLYATYIDGSNIYLRVNSGNTVALSIDSSGNVTIEKNLIVKGNSASGGISGSNIAYLPLTGGIISNPSTSEPLTINNPSAGGAWIKFTNQSGNLGYFGYNSEDIAHCTDANGVERQIIHKGNIESSTAGYAYALVSNSGATIVSHNAANNYVNVRGIAIGYGGNTIEMATSAKLYIQKNVTQNTIINQYGGSVGIGVDPTLGKKLQINSSTWTGFLALNRTAANSGAAISCYANGSHLGDFGINGSGQFELDGNNGAARFWVTANDGFTSIGYTSHAHYCQLDVNGSVRCTQVINSSDIRYKNKIDDVILHLDVMADAPLFLFTWNNRDDHSIHLGSSAQYWEAHRKEIVMDGGIKSMDYATLGVAMGISLARELLSEKERNNEQDRRLEKIESKLNERYNGAVC